MTKRELQEMASALEAQTLLLTLQTGANQQTRTLYLVGHVDHDMLYKFITGFHTLDQTEGLIRVILASTGGSVPDGYAIYDTIKLSRNAVLIDCFGACMSIAALILQSGDMRRMAPESRFMIHNGSVALDTVNADTLVSIGQEIERENERYQKILADRSGLPIPKVVKLCRDEAYFSAPEAVANGFADVVLVHPEKNAKIVLEPDKKVSKKKKKRK